MDINEFFKRTETDSTIMLSELVETQCAVKGLLHSIISELSNGNPDKETELLSIAEKVKERELLRVVARFASQDPD